MNNTLCNPLFGNAFLTMSQPKTHLKYAFIPVESACEFQILEQSKEVYNILSKGYYQASNGMRVAIAQFPEFKDSANTVYLRGSDKSKDLKVDTTRFVRNSVRDNKMELVTEALAEFVNFVKKSYKPAPSLLDEFFGTALRSNYNNIKVVTL